MSNDQSSKTPKSQAAQGGGPSGSGAAPLAATPEALSSPYQEIDAATRKKLAKGVECEPDQVLSYRDYADRTIVVVQTKTTVEKREIKAA